MRCKNCLSKKIVMIKREFKEKWNIKEVRIEYLETKTFKCAHCGLEHII